MEWVVILNITARKGLLEKLTFVENLKKDIERRSYMEYLGEK